MDLACEKIDAALVVKDQEGVAVAQVRAAKRALDSGQIEQTRALLQNTYVSPPWMTRGARGESSTVMSQTGSIVMTAIAGLLPGWVALGRVPR